MNFVLSSIYWRLLMKASLFGSPNFCWWSCKLWWRPFWRSTMARIDFVRTMTMPIMLINSMMRSTQASVNNHGYLNPVFKTPRPRNFDTKKILQKQIYENPLFLLPTKLVYQKNIDRVVPKNFNFLPIWFISASSSNDQNILLLQKNSFLSFKFFFSRSASVDAKLVS